ncbi:MAG: helix-turn-helix domain-containing protein, partial [Pseudomonadota bacterium]
MVYSFSGQPVHIPQNHFCVFWAAHPHRTIDVLGEGSITNAYVSLEEFWTWPLPKDFLDQLLSGAVLLAREPLEGDEVLTQRWAQERSYRSEQHSRLHCLELQARLTRMALDGWTVAAAGTRRTSAHRVGGHAIVHFERMLRFIALNSCNAISLEDVASAASVSKNYANTLFKKILGTTVKAHIREIRVYRAKTLLVETDDKILRIAMDCGFRSLSAFYESFQSATGTTPALFRKSLLTTKDYAPNGAGVLPSY